MKQLAFLLVAAAAATPSHAAAAGSALAAALARDPIPAAFQGKAQSKVLDIPPEERAQGLIGAILVTIPADKSHIRYFVFDTYANAERSYKRYVQQPWGSPMQRLAQEELTPGSKDIAPGKMTCELQRNDSTRIHAGACLHLNARLPVLTRGTKPVKFNDSLKFGDAKTEQARHILAAVEATDLMGPGSLQADKAGRR